MTESFINNSQTIRVLDIVYGTSVDGVGLRTSIYCAGCRNFCEGCHNPQSWDESGGRVMWSDELLQLILKADMPVTFTGGDPMLHPEGFTTLARLIRKHSDFDIWCYTGYTFETILQDPPRRELLQEVDVLVDGPFVMALRDTSLLFRGSSNQRVIDVRRSLEAGQVVLFDFSKIF